MEIETPTKSGGTITKQIRVDGGVKFRVNGFRFLMDGTVLEIDEDAQQLRVHGQDFDGWIPREQVVDSITPEEEQFQQIYHQNVKKE